MIGRITQAINYLIWGFSSHSEFNCNKEEIRIWDLISFLWLHEYSFSYTNDEDQLSLDNYGSPNLQGDYILADDSNSLTPQAFLHVIPRHNNPSLGISWKIDYTTVHVLKMGVADIVPFNNGYINVWDFQELIPHLFRFLVLLVKNFNV